jgi:putative hemolysin
MKAKTPEYLRSGASSRHLPKPVNDFLRRIVNRLAGFTTFNATYQSVIANGIPDNIAACFLQHIGVTVEINRNGLERVPRTGPLIVVANHPFGIIDGMMLNAVMTSIRDDYKVLAIYEFGKIPGFSRSLFSVDPMKSRKRQRNLSAWLAVFKWLKGGGSFGIFPAGQASRFSFRHRRVTDIAWSHHAATLAKRTGAPVLPVYFPGRNGLLFQLIGIIHGELQTFLLIPTFNRMHGRRLKMVVGEVIEPQEICALGSDAQAIEFLRERTYALARGADSADYVQFIGAGRSTIS